MPEDPIEHVIVLMLENRSFDHMLGSMRAVLHGLDGIDPLNPGVNSDKDGQPFRQMPTSFNRLSDIGMADPRHETNNTLTQLDHGGQCGGFVYDFSTAYELSTRQQRAEIMNYFRADSLPVLHALAREFMVCDRWFASVPGPTWTNRFFLQSGTSLGRVVMPESPFDVTTVSGYDQTTVFDRLDEAGQGWRVYFHDVPHSLAFSHQRTPRHAARYRKMDWTWPARGFYAAAQRPASEFPAFCVIEPDYFGANRNDQHPPSDVMRGEALLANVFNTIRANEALWRSSLLVLIYDEHGGFYDHVYPPPAAPPDQHQDEFTFDRYGVRIPAVLISPWTDQRVSHTVFDHTSVLRYLVNKWNLGDLGARTAVANSIAEAMTRSSPRDDVLSITAPSAPPPFTRQFSTEFQRPAEPLPLDDLQISLVALSEQLERETEEPAEVKDLRATRMRVSRREIEDVAKERTERFLEQQRVRSRLEH